MPALLHKSAVTCVNADQGTPAEPAQCCKAHACHTEATSMTLNVVNDTVATQKLCGITGVNADQSATKANAPPTATKSPNATLATWK